MTQCNKDVETQPEQNGFAEKVSKGGPFAVTQARLDQIDRNIILNLGGQYLEWVAADIYQMEQALAVTRAGDRIDSPAMKQFRHHVHEMRGMGSTFEFELISGIADQLHRLIHKFEVLSEEIISVVRVHVDAINVVIVEELRGDGGPHGQEIMDGLKQVYKKYA